MKHLIGYIVIAISFLLIGWLLTSQCTEPPEMPDRTEELDSLKALVVDYADSANILLEEIAELKMQTAKIDTYIIKVREDIDVSVKEDSSNSIIKYREQIAVLEEDVLGEFLIDKRPLSYSEITKGALYFNELVGMRLKVRTQKKSILKLEELVSNQQFQISGYRDITDIQDIEIDRWKLKYEKEAKWYNSRLFGFIVGIVGTSVVYWTASQTK
jgi:hypothetical protein